MDYKNHIGDGKLPNRYWVFHYDIKFTRNNYELMPISKPDSLKGELLGEFSTYAEAINCVNNKAYYPYVFIEDRLSGMIFEQIVIVCPCCKKEDYTTYEDLEFTKKILKTHDIEFN